MRLNRRSASILVPMMAALGTLLSAGAAGCQSQRHQQRCKISQLCFRHHQQIPKKVPDLFSHSSGAAAGTVAWLVDRCRFGACQRRNASSGGDRVETGVWSPRALPEFLPQQQIQ